MLLIVALAVFVVQGANAQQGAAPAKGGAKADDVVTYVKAVAEHLGMLRSVNRVDAMNFLEYWASGTTNDNALGEPYKKDGPWPAVPITYHVTIGYAIPAMRVDIMHTGAGAGPKREIEVVNGNTAWNESEPGAGLVPGKGTATPAPGTADARQLQIWLTPYGAMKMAMKAGADVKRTQEGDETILTFPASGMMMKVSVSQNKLVDKVEVTGNNMVSEATYSNYADLGDEKSGTLFPGHITIKQAGFPILDVTASKDDPNNPYMIFPVPDGIAGK